MDLPKEILMDIFSRLPTKSVGRFRSLSKTWRDSLSSRHFIKSHLARQKSRHEENLIFITSWDSKATRCTETIKCNTNVVSRDINLPGDLNYCTCSCDGLLLFEKQDGEVFLWNPITLEQVNIPHSPLSEDCASDVKCGVTYGFGYDSVRDDYKVVAFFGFLHYQKYGTDTYVYSVKKGVWKRLDISPYICSSTYIPPGAFFNGALHWMGNENVIVALDFANEAFLEFPLPVDYFSSLATLVVFGGCLCVMDTHGYGTATNIWVMKDYGVAESWTKLNLYEDSFEPLCCIGDIEKVVTEVCGKLVVYNLKEGTSTVLVADATPDPGGYVPFVAFVESLVSPALLQ